MPTTSEGIEGRLRALADPVVSHLGCELVDLEYRREPGGWMVRLYIDRAGGVTLDDCQTVSQDFGTLLEVEDPIPHAFQLEVSSPGLDRPLRRQADFVAAQGRRVRLTTRQPIQGQRNFNGILESASAEPPDHPATLILRDETGALHQIPRADVEKAHIVFEWPDGSRQGGRKSHKAGKKKR